MFNLLLFTIQNGGKWFQFLSGKYVSIVLNQSVLKLIQIRRPLTVNG